jgi:cupin fold WbuC family metalloprotein
MIPISDRWVAQSSEVFYARPGTMGVTVEDIAALKEMAKRNPRGRCRFCLHGNVSDRLHDMVIAFMPGAYDRPHRHLSREETLVVLDGEAKYIHFSEVGQPQNLLNLSASGASNASRLVRTPIGQFHNLLIGSETFVFCESTLGPFDPASSEFSSWSPISTDTATVDEYLAGLAKWAGKAT